MKNMICFFFMENTAFFLFSVKKIAFLKSKKSTNLLVIWPQMCFIRNFEILALKLLLFEILKISQRPKWRENEDCDTK